MEIEKFVIDGDAKVNEILENENVPEMVKEVIRNKNKEYEANQKEYLEGYSFEY